MVFVLFVFLGTARLLSISKHPQMQIICPGLLRPLHSSTLDHFPLHPFYKNGKPSHSAEDTVLLRRGIKLAYFINNQPGRSTIIPSPKNHKQFYFCTSHSQPDRGKTEASKAVETFFQSQMI